MRDDYTTGGAVARVMLTGARRRDD